MALLMRLCIFLVISTWNSFWKIYVGLFQHLWLDESLLKTFYFDVLKAKYYTTKFNSVHLKKEEFLSWAGLRAKRTWKSSPWQLMQWYFRYLIWKQRRKSISLATAGYWPYLDLVWWFFLAYLNMIWWNIWLIWTYCVDFALFGHGMIIFLSVIFW